MPRCWQPVLSLFHWQFNSGKLVQLYEPAWWEFHSLKNFMSLFKSSTSPARAIRPWLQTTLLVTSLFLLPFLSRWWKRNYLGSLSRQGGYTVTKGQCWSCRAATCTGSSHPRLGFLVMEEGIQMSSWLTAASSNQKLWRRAGLLSFRKWKKLTSENVSLLFHQG